MKSINLLPPKPSIRGGAKLPLLAGLPLAAAAIVLVGLTVLWQYQTDRLLDQATVIAAANAKLQAEGVPIAELNERTDAHRFVENIETGRTPWKTYLDAILQPLPANASVVSLSVGENRMLHMEVDFRSYEHSVDYVQELESAPQLRDVTVLSYNRRTDEHTTFAPAADGTIATLRETTYKTILDFAIEPLDAQEGGPYDGGGK